MNNRDMPAKAIINMQGFPSHDSVIDKHNCHGLTKLEYAAIQIMAGIHANDSADGAFITNEAAARYAINAANALFDELEKEQ